MSFTSAQKGKARASSTPSSSSASSSSDSDSDVTSSSSESESESELEDPNKYLELARENIRAKAAAGKDDTFVSLAEIDDEEDVIALGDPEDVLQKLPPLDPGELPDSYFAPGPSKRKDARQARDLDAARTISAAEKLQLGAPAPPVPSKPSGKDGKPLTKREKKEMREKTAGKDWFDLPAPRAVDLPRLYREVEALRMRNQLDPKRFYRKDEGEGKGIKGLPKHFAIGQIIPTSTPFGGNAATDLPRAERKRTLVDELVDDAETARYAKRKFLDLQGQRARNGRGTLHERNKKRKPKW
ncbi:unnamed protein product [Peniophora sp. CBMAI 1063]|nr:unnamed protein product [Peniophora sp. CBMAI 1063]